MAKNELEMMTQSSRIILGAISDMYAAVSYARLNESLGESERLKAEMLWRLTNGGKEVPYLQEYGAETTKLSLELKKKIEEYNLTALDEEKINFFHSSTLDGHQVLWTDKAGAEKIAELRREMLVELGGFFPEITPSDLYRANIEKEVVTFEGVTEQELLILKSGMGIGSADFSFAAIPNGDGTYQIEVAKEDFISAKGREDLFVNMIRANAITNDAQNRYLCEELAYEKELMARALVYDKEDPTYITSATDAGKYIKIDNKGFSVYTIGMDGNDIRQKVEMQIEKEKYSPEDYQSRLHREIATINKPVELNNEICKQKEKQLEQIYGKEGNLYAKDTRIKAVIMQDLEKTRMRFASIREKKAPDLLKQLERESNRALAAGIATQILYDKMRKGEGLKKDEVSELLATPAVRNMVRSTFFKEHLIHMEPDLHKEFMDRIKDTELYKQFVALNVNPDLKEDITRQIEASYEDFYLEMPTEFQMKVERKYQNFENEIKMNCKAALEKGLSPATHETIARIQNDKNDKALQVILAKSVTGKTIEEIRPLQSDIRAIQRSEYDDELMKLFALKVEDKLKERVKDHSITPDILHTDAYTQAVKDASNEIMQRLRDESLKKESKKWAAVIKHGDYVGGIDETKLKELERSALAIGDYETDVHEITQDEMSWVVDKEKAEPEKWGMLKYEHDEQQTNNILKSSVQIEDVDLSGSVERMQNGFSQRIADLDINDNEDIDGDFVPKKGDGEDIENDFEEDALNKEDEEVDVDFD